MRYLLLLLLVLPLIGCELTEPKEELCRIAEKRIEYDARYGYLPRMRLESGNWVLVEQDTYDDYRVGNMFSPCIDRQRHGFWGD